MALLLLHGSDAAVAAGLALLRVACEEMMAALPHVLSQHLPDASTTANKAMDRHVIQQIIYSMKEDTPINCDVNIVLGMLGYPCLQCSVFFCRRATARWRMPSTPTTSIAKMPAQSTRIGHA